MPSASAGMLIFFPWDLQHFLPWFLGLWVWNGSASRQQIMGLHSSHDRRSQSSMIAGVSPS